MCCDDTAHNMISFRVQRGKTNYASPLVYMYIHHKHNCTAMAMADRNDDYDDDDNDKHDYSL